MESRTDFTMGAPQRSPFSNKLAIMSLVSGVLLLGIEYCFGHWWTFFTLQKPTLQLVVHDICGPFLAVSAVACGHIALKRPRKMPLQRGSGFLACTGAITGYVGAAVWILLPFANAKAAYPAGACRANLQQLSIAARIWAGDHDDTYPSNLLSLTNEMSNPGILICPLDPNHKRLPSTVPMTWDATNITYEFLTSGVAESNVTDRTVVFRCPFHGFEVMGDGSVRSGPAIR
ncbi:MAG: hypothetical protein JWQ04_1684 [Pedosphaera sp.]|nr:hypothetical protein [Pedosphaera sp.]